MTKHYTEEGGSCVPGKIISFAELIRKDIVALPKVFTCTTKTKNLVIKEIGLESFKNEARLCGMDVIHIMDDIFGPVKEEIWL